MRDSMLSLRDPMLGPDDGVLMTEESDRRVAILPKTRFLKEVARRRLDHWDDDEIAEDLGITRAAVSRKLRLIHKIWEENGLKRQGEL